MLLGLREAQGVTMTVQGSDFDLSGEDLSLGVIEEHLEDPHCRGD